MEMYLLKSRSENTNSKYFSAFERWERFITLEGEIAVPATPIHVALYLTYLNLTVIKNPEKHKVIIDKSLTTVKSLESLYLYNIQLNILL
jgi:hypothetical protein